MNNVEFADCLTPQPKKPTGGSNSYYDVTIDGKVISCQDIIEALQMNFAQGNIFKAIWRMGAKPGVEAQYDLEKIIWFANREIERMKNAKV